MALSQTGSEGERLPDVRFFQVGEIGEKLLDRAPYSKRFHDHADRYTHASNAWLSAHYLWIHRYTSKLLHVAIITHPAKVRSAPAPRIETSRTAARTGPRNLETSRWTNVLLVKPPTRSPQVLE